MITRWFARCILLSCYGATLLLCLLFRRAKPRRFSGRVLATATFFNPGWYRAHIVPLALSATDEVILVTDEVVELTEGVRYCCPPRWVTKLASRAGAKLGWGLAAAIRRRPDWCVGYHLFPGALSALIIGRLVRRPVCYQMTGGPVELIGGGYEAENRLLVSLGRPSDIVERWALAVVRRFDLIVTRGDKAKRYLESRGVTCPIEIIPGAVTDPSSPGSCEGSFGGRAPSPPLECDARQDSTTAYDLVFVGRLTEVKQPDQFVRIIAEVRRTVPTVNAVMVGDGPLAPSLARLAAELGVAEIISLVGARNDVGAFLARSRIFVMTSRSEGLSIALLEAMAAGLPAVVADVGELGEAVENGKTGWIITPDSLSEYAQRIVSLLQDASTYEKMSSAAHKRAIELASVDAVCSRWRCAIDAMCGVTPSKSMVPDRGIHLVRGDKS